MSEADTTNGTVGFFNDQQGYGFIELDGDEEDVFFHISDVDALTIDEGADVEFGTQAGDRGPRAVNVRKV